MVQKVSDTYSFNMELIKNYRNFLIKLNAILIMVKSSIELTRFIAHKIKHRCFRDRDTVKGYKDHFLCIFFLTACSLLFQFL